MDNPYGYLVTYGWNCHVRSASPLIVRTMRTRSLWDAYQAFQIRGSKNYHMIHSFPLTEEQYHQVGPNQTFEDAP